MTGQVNVLITGGFGFIGKNIVSELMKQEKIKAIVFNDSILSKEKVQRAMKNVEVVIHLAAQTWLDKSVKAVASMVETNVVGTAILLEAALKSHVKKFILFSTAGINSNKLNPYTASKLAAEKIAYSFHLTYGLPLVILRPSNVYGPYQRPPRMISLFISKLLHNQPIFLNHQGRPSRDWIYVGDVARAVKLIIDSPINMVNGEIFNVGIGESMSNLQVAQKIAKELKRNIKLIKLRKSGFKESMENRVISQKIAKTLGWKPNYSFKDGLLKTIRWHREEENLMKEKKANIKKVAAEIV